MTFFMTLDEQARENDRARAEVAALGIRTMPNAPGCDHDEHGFLDSDFSRRCSECDFSHISRTVCGVEFCQRCADRAWARSLGARVPS